MNHGSVRGLVCDLCDLDSSACSRSWKMDKVGTNAGLSCVCADGIVFPRLGRVCFEQRTLGKGYGIGREHGRVFEAAGILASSGGKKYKQTEAALGSPTYILILALVNEATRHLIQFHMIASHNHIASPGFSAVYADGGAARYPPLLDLMHPSVSILVSVLQYMSTILCNPASWSRITLLLRHRNVDSVEQLLQCYPADVQLFQLGIRAAMVAHKVRINRYTRPSVK